MNVSVHDSETGESWDLDQLAGSADDIVTQLELVAQGFELQARPGENSNELSRIRAESNFFNPALDKRVVDGLRARNVIAERADDFRTAALALARLFTGNRDLVAAQTAALTINWLSNAFRVELQLSLDILRRAHHGLRTECARIGARPTHMRQSERADYPLVREHARRLEESSARSPVRRKKNVRHVTTHRPLPSDSESARVLRPLLAGRKVLLIGGERDPQRERDTADAFGCTVEQIELGHCQSTTRLLPALRDPNVVIAAVLIRFTKHETLPAVAKMARRFNLPVVTVPCGFSQATLSKAILDQAGARLARGRIAGAA